MIAGDGKTILRFWSRLSQDDVAKSLQKPKSKPAEKKEDRAIVPQDNTAERRRQTT